MEWSRIWNIEPIQFHPELIERCREAIMETAGVAHQLPSGPLHDAAEVSRAGIPTVMLFVQSLGGISHNKIEDTSEEHLEMAVRAFDRLATKTMSWIQHTDDTPLAYARGYTVTRGLEDIKASYRAWLVLTAPGQLTARSYEPRRFRLSLRDGIAYQYRATAGRNVANDLTKVAGSAADSTR